MDDLESRAHKEAGYVHWGSDKGQKAHLMECKPSTV